MKLINLKAWHIERKKMYWVEEIGLWADEDQCPITLMDDFEGEDVQSIDVELLRSTGILDINGKLIFEGDIIEYMDCEYGLGELYHETLNRGSVEWCLDTASYFVTNRISVEMIDIFNNNEALKVVGNIYENPELV